MDLIKTGPDTYVLRIADQTWVGVSAERALEIIIEKGL